MSIIRIKTIPAGSQLDPSRFPSKTYRKFELRYLSSSDENLGKYEKEGQRSPSVSTREHSIFKSRVAESFAAQGGVCKVQLDLRTSEGPISWLKICLLGF